MDDALEKIMTVLILVCLCCLTFSLIGISVAMIRFYIA